jgi:UDP-GlcNAc:undecaprenyl-phosphate/decaprenyl-phosphate GlcNAc-1-phosphate transferase
MTGFNTAELLWLSSALIIINGLATSRYITKLWIKSYQDPQRIHVNEVSRLGGLGMLIGVAGLAGLSESLATSALAFKFLVAFVPLAMIMLMEDLHINTRPAVRLTVILLSSYLILTLTKVTLPSFNTPFLDTLFATPFLSPLFFILCIAALINGMNFIDGTNGNMVFTSLSILAVLYAMAALLGDNDVMRLAQVFALPLALFIPFNYPFGKLFAGDLGSYLCGATTAFLVIYFFGRHPEISAWNAVLVVFYPTMELTYSIARKVLTQKSPFLPDREHLHIKLFIIFNRGSNRPRLSNNLVTLILSVFWLWPAVIIPWVYQSHLLLFSSLIFLTGAYIVLNWVIPVIETENTETENSGD